MVPLAFRECEIRAKRAEASVIPSRDMTGVEPASTLFVEAFIRRILRIACALILGFSADVAASPGAYSDASLSAAGVPGGVSQLDFESLADGALGNGNFKPCFPHHRYDTF
jgi:hypothetical protein